MTPNDKTQIHTAQMCNIRPASSSITQIAWHDTLQEVLSISISTLPSSQTILARSRARKLAGGYSKLIKGVTKK